MSEAMSAQAAPAPVMSDFDHAYKLGMLSGEVRLLKWAVAAALVAILGSMGVLYDAIDDVRVELVETRKDIFDVKTDVTVLKTDVAVLKTDVAVLKTDVADLKTDVAVLKTDVAVLKSGLADLTTDVSDLKAMHSPSMEDTHGRPGSSRALPGHADAAGESVPPASTIPPA